MALSECPAHVFNLDTEGKRSREKARDGDRERRATLYLSQWHALNNDKPQASPTVAHRCRAAFIEFPSRILAVTYSCSF